MTSAGFYQTQLQNSLELLKWVTTNLADHLTEEPPATYTQWSVQRHIYHLWVYEHYVTAMMRSWLADAAAPSDDTIQEFNTLWANQATDWSKIPFDEILTRLTTVRQEQIDLIGKYTQDDWQRKMPMVWGDVSLEWTVAKTIQHATEHTDTLMKLNLWWQTSL